MPSWPNRARMPLSGHGLRSSAGGSVRRHCARPHNAARSRAVLRAARGGGDGYTVPVHLANQLVIEQAKGLLMKLTGIDENDAFTRLQSLASEKNQKLIDAARNILAKRTIIHAGLEACGGIGVRSARKKQNFWTSNQFTRRIQSHSMRLNF